MQVGFAFLRGKDVLGGEKAVTGRHSRTFEEAADMIKNIVFDLGQVLINFQPEEYLQRLFPQHSHSKTLQKAIFGSVEWLMLDRGVIDQEEAQVRLISQHPHLRHEITEALSHWFTMLTPIEENVELLPQIKERGYGLYVISNFHKDAFAHIEAKYDWFGLFDGLVISCHHRLLKPEPQIYLELLRGFQLLGEECLFIDDIASNVVGARRMGIEAILYQSPEELRRDLALLL